MSRFVAAACQLDSRDDKAANVERALGLLDEAAADGADFVAFPEMTTFIGPEERFDEVAESLDGPTIQRLFREGPRARRFRPHGELLRADSEQRPGVQHVGAHRPGR
nr:nitrilase-related carbon-nitrogen hydrolase [Haloferax sp. ATB1]